MYKTIFNHKQQLKIIGIHPEPPTAVTKPENIKIHQEPTNLKEIKKIKMKKKPIKKQLMILCSLSSVALFSVYCSLLPYSMVFPEIQGKLVS